MTIFDEIEEDRKCTKCEQKLPKPECKKCNDSGQIVKMNGNAYTLVRCSCGKMPPVPQISDI